jgi:hypothetical protein
VAGNADRPRATRLTITVVATPATKNAGIAKSLINAPFWCVTKSVPASTKLPVTCATNSPNSARKVQLST